MTDTIHSTVITEPILAHLASFPATENMESVPGWAAKGAGGAALWLTAGDTKATVTALASGGTAAGACLGFFPMPSKVC